MPTFNSCTRRKGRPGKIHDAHQISNKFPGHGTFKTERSFDSQAALVIDVRGLFSFDMLSMGV